MPNKKAKNLPRRQFLQGLAATSVIVGASAHAEEPPQSQKNRRVPMLQSWTDEDSALVVVLGKAGWSFASALRSDLKITILKILKLTGTDQVLYHLNIQGLNPTSESAFVILDNRQQAIETRRLRGLDLKKSSPKIAVASCGNYRKLDGQDAIYTQVLEQKPDLMLFIGDIVYSNSRTSSVFKRPEEPAKALERYLITWNTVNLYQLDPLVPTLATWDDHDYGTNNGDINHPYKQEMKAIFRNFYALPQAHPNLSFGPGVAFRAEAFGLDLYMMDSRTDFVKRNTQWGPQQENWLVRDFNSSSRPAWILNGVQYFKYFMILECIEKNGPNTLAMLKNLLRTKKKPMALFSGDVHSSQVQELPPDVFGFKTYEITSSGVHCNTAGSVLKRSPEEGQLFYYGENNFLIIRPSVQNSVMDLDISCATEQGTVSVAQRPFRIAV